MSLRPIAEIAPLMGVCTRQARRRLHALAAVEPGLLVKRRGKLLVNVDILARREGYADDAPDIEALTARVTELERRVEILSASVRNSRSILRYK